MVRGQLGMYPWPDDILRRYSGTVLMLTQSPTEANMEVSDYGMQVCRA